MRSDEFSSLTWISSGDVHGCSAIWYETTEQSRVWISFSFSVLLSLFFQPFRGTNLCKYDKRLIRLQRFPSPLSEELSLRSLISLSLKPVLTADMQFSRNFLCNFVLRLESPEEKYIGKITSHTADFALCLCDYISCASLICNDK